MVITPYPTCTDGHILSSIQMVATPYPTYRW